MKSKKKSMVQWPRGRGGGRKNTILIRQDFQGFILMDIVRIYHICFSHMFLQQEKSIHREKG